MRRLKAGAGDLRRAARLFHVLAVGTRVEHERLGTEGADFEGLAATVETLAADFASRSDSIAETCAGTRETISHALAAASLMENRRGRDLPLILRAASDSLSALTASQQQAADFSRSLAGDFDAIAHDISETIDSVQYQDITRQRLEHVAEALEHGAARLRAGEPSALRDAAAVAQLESVQLRAAATDFGTAVARIEDALDSMAGRIGAMVEQAGQTLAVGPDGHLFRDLEKGLGAVAAAVEDYARSARLLDAAENSVAPAIEPISGFASHIQEIGIRMQRISLNASIKAARLADAGAAMNAVAEAIQRAVADSNERTGQVLAAIGEISAWSGRVPAGTDRAEGRRRGRSDASRHHTRRSPKGSFGTGRKPRRGRHGARRRCESFGFASSRSAPFSGVLDRCADDLERRAAELAVDAGALDRLRNLEDRYTMHAERALHSAVIGGVAEALAGRRRYGGNVEFF